MKLKKLDLLAIVSDLHVGSHVGLLCPGYRTIAATEAERQTVQLNPLQHWLWSCWSDGAERVAEICGNDPYALLLNGDAVEGDHHRTWQIWSRNPDDHVAAAITALHPYSEPAEEVIVISGTECHTGLSEVMLAKSIGAHVADLACIRIHGTLIEARHHTGATSRVWLESGGPMRDMNNRRLECARKGHEVPQGALYAHRHTGGWADDGYGFAAVTGAWQALTRHGKKVVGHAIPSPTIIVLDWRGLPDGAMPRHHVIRYTARPDLVGTTFDFSKE